MPGGKKSRILIGTVTALAFAIGLFFSYILLGPFLPRYCSTESIESVPEKTTIPVLTPAVLPEGYSFQLALVTSNEIRLFYFDRPLCGKIEGGTIEVTGHKMNPSLNMTATQYIDSLYEQQKHFSYIKEHYIFDDNRHGYSVSYNPTQYYITTGDDNTNTLYNIHSNLERQQVEAIAKSLYEVKVPADRQYPGDAFAIS